MKFLFSVSILLILFGFDAVSQDWPFDVNHYNFVRYDLNKLKFSKDSSSFDRVYQKLDSMIIYGKGSLNVLQLGASHTQADIFSSRMRTRLQTVFPGLIGSRGFVFPYKITKTNNPSNYSIRYSGYWSSCRNVEWNRSCSLGISGVSATTTDLTADLLIVQNGKNSIIYDFNIVKVICRPGGGQFNIVPDDICGGYTLETDTVNGFRIFKFDRYLKEVSFKFAKSDSSQTEFCLFGMMLENDNPGITYSAIGINGASITSWLSCTYFMQQLKVLNPDWIVIFLGVNDGNSTRFNPSYFSDNYDKLLRIIKTACPQTAITLIVPNDFYLYRRRPNPAMPLENSSINNLINSHNVSMWSLFEVMGGFGSSAYWVRNGLMASDKVHLTYAGYTLAADLFFNSFLQSYSFHIKKNVR